MNNMTIGQYIPGNSWLHQLDPRIKMMSLIMLLISIFLIPIQEIKWIYTCWQDIYC